MAQTLMSENMSNRQALAFVDLMTAFLKDCIRIPSYGMKDGRLEMAWSFSDVPNYAFTLEVYDNGRFEWFFRDGNGLVAGSESSIWRLPDEAWKYLKEHFSK